MLEQIENLGRQTLEVFVILQNLSHAEFTDLLAESLSWLGHDIGLHASVHVVLNVDGVGLGNLHEHANVIFVVLVFLLIRMEQMLVLFQVFDNLAIDSLVLQSAVQNDEHFSRDRPVVEV